MKIIVFDSETTGLVGRDENIYLSTFLVRI